MLNERKRKWFDGIVWSLSLLFAAALVTSARAESHRFAVDNAAYRTECGSCHIAYPPALLDQSAWRAIMQGLDKHFGTDASVGESTRAEIGAYLAGSKSRKDSSSPTLRISDTPWFRKEHSDIAPATWKSPTVKSAANCEACHRQASAGDYSERNVRIPR